MSYLGRERGCLLLLPMALVSPGSQQRLSRGAGGRKTGRLPFKASDSWLLTGGGCGGCVSNYLCRWGQIPRGDKEPQVKMRLRNCWREMGSDDESRPAPRLQKRPVWVTSRCSIITCPKGRVFELEGRSVCCVPANGRVSEVRI